MEIKKNVIYVGVNDYDIDLFEGQYKVPSGMSYNSYLIIDEKIAVMDSVDIRFADLWINKTKNALEGKTPDYLIVQHMEPDHSSSIIKFIESFGDVTVVASKRAFDMMIGFFGRDFAKNRIVVGDGDSLSIGKRKFTFITAPMVHWPEVILTLDDFDKILFSADAFGRFGAIGSIQDEISEMRRYYFGIVGKYGKQVQNLLTKLGRFDFDTICSLHGPALTDNLHYYINLYDIWSSYHPETQGVCIAYASIYGNTKAAAELLARLLGEMGITVNIFDLARCDMHQAVENAFKNDTLVLACSTYNADMFPVMRAFIDHLTDRNFQNRKIAFIENGSWAPGAIKAMKNMLEKSKNLIYITPEVTITSSLNEEIRRQINLLADNLSKRFTISD